MRSRDGVASLIALGAVAIAPAAVVGAAEPVDVSITSHTVRGCPLPDSCTFSASGAVVDSGSVSGVLVRFGAENSPVTGEAQYVITFNGQYGSLTVRMQSRLSLTDVRWQLHEDDEWTLVDATGDYSGARGQGLASGTRDFRQQSLDLVYTGRIQLP
jgi:hypothetical protein